MSFDTRGSRSRADIIAYESTGDRLLIAEVKSSAVPNPDTLVTHVVTQVGDAAYVLLVDPREMRLYREEGNGKRLAAVLKTPQVLNFYDEDFGKGRIFEEYLTSLTEAWLRDLAFHWKLQHPPGGEELRDTGLLERLAGGTTETEVSAHGDPVR